MFAPITLWRPRWPNSLRTFGAPARGWTDARCWSRKPKRVDVECVVRGYLAGSGWKEYQESQSCAG
jgi:phosphoribosylaminoimidazole-succinocarboxamide synthase